MVLCHVCLKADTQAGFFCRGCQKFTHNTCSITLPASKQHICRICFDEIMLSNASTQVSAPFTPPPSMRSDRQRPRSGRVEIAPYIEAVGTLTGVGDVLTAANEAKRHNMLFRDAFNKVPSVSEISHSLKASKQSAAEKEHFIHTLTAGQGGALSPRTVFAATFARPIPFRPENCLSCHAAFPKIQTYEFISHQRTLKCFHCGAIHVIKEDVR